MSLTAEIAVSSALYSFDKLFSYAIPEELSQTIACGCRVIVPFGIGNNHRVGMIFRLSKSETKGLKSIISVIDIKPVLSEELLGLAEYLHSRTFCTWFDAVKTMLSPAMSIKISEKYILLQSNYSSKDLSVNGSELLKKLRLSKNEQEFDSIIEEHITANGRKYLDELCKKGLLCPNDKFRQNVKDAYVKSVRLTQRYLDSPEEISLTEKQKKVADFLMDNGAMTVNEAAYMCGVTPIVIKNLAEKGAAEEYEAEYYRIVDSEEYERVSPENIVLSEEQQNVFDAVSKRIASGRPEVFLLHGVTGSGKTSVFEKLIHFTISSGKKAMLLIPEIGLTPQVQRRFKALFGERVAVIHSGLSLFQRFDEYKRIKRGEADIVIGTRSAVFAPLEDIGIIILDEEGERSYKSESSPRYYTHDIAKQRCAYHGAVLLLASATPSVESYYYAEKGVYHLLEMKHRYSSSILPDVEIVDMNEERSCGNITEFSRRLTNEIKQNLENGEQTILLLNRRGYHTIINCCDCSQPVYCPNCSVPLTYHKKNDRMMCHYCGYVSEMPEKCPTCGSVRLRHMGFGTQKLEEELNMYFPQARILRMDADTTFSRYSYEKGFNAFRRGEYDIMAGTQMIGKGLDFPNVTLVGVLSVDKALFAGDFRSYERTFSLITQVVGRSGRGEKKGRAVLQTFMPDHYVMNLAAGQDYKAFYNEEIAIRRAMIFPPICDMCILAFAGNTEEQVKKGTDAVMELMRASLRRLQPKTPVRVLGPVRCSYGKLNGKYRYRIIIKCKNNAEMRGFISSILKESSKLRDMSGVSLYADMNGDAGV